MSLWDWMLARYGQPGVPEAALSLQDEHGQQTAYLLWAAWASLHGRAPSAETLAQAAAFARGWESEVLGPLRAARKALKPPRPPADDAAREGLREDVKAAEMRAERTLSETLASLPGAGSASAREGLGRASAAWGAAPDAALDRLAAALG